MPRTDVCGAHAVNLEHRAERWDSGASPTGLAALAAGLDDGAVVGIVVHRPVGSHARDQGHEATEERSDQEGTDHSGEVPPGDSQDECQNWCTDGPSPGPTPDSVTLRHRWWWRRNVVLVWLDVCVLVGLLDPDVLPAGPFRTQLWSWLFRGGVLDWFSGVLVGRPSRNIWRTIGMPQVGDDGVERSIQIRCLVACAVVGWFFRSWCHDEETPDGSTSSSQQSDEQTRCFPRRSVLRRYPAWRRENCY